MNVEQNAIDVGAIRCACAPAAARRLQRRLQGIVQEQGFCLVASTPAAPSRLPEGSVIGGTTADAEASAGANRRMAAA
jgi:hypothetical protein